MTALAIDYVPPNRNREGRIVGIDVAVRTLLDAFAHYADVDSFLCRTADAAAFEELHKHMAQRDGDPGRWHHLGVDTPLETVGAGTLFRPDPNINGLIARRTKSGPQAYSVCGLSHTMSSMQVMGTVATAITQPLQSWDAVVCPSRAIRGVVESLWEAASQGAALPPAQLPVIPLGIDTARFSALTGDGMRAAQRLVLGADAEDVVVLFYGRLSYHDKAHPLPLLLAAERVAARRQAGGLPGRLHLVFYGYFTGDAFREDYQKAAAVICENAAVRFVENDDPDFPDALWAGADIFVSLVDNVQESFGLTPIEAMAAGLPAVVSDWDGYRDTVRDGEDGFLIPTAAPDAGAGLELARRYLAGEDVYGEYLAGVSQSVAVDIDVTAEAIGRLADDAELRNRMGAAGRQRAHDIFDWRSVVPAYDALWSELAERRERDAVSKPVAAHAITGPAEMDPYRVFRGFPTFRMMPDDAIVLTDRATAVLADRLRHRMNMFVPVNLLAPEDLPRLLSRMQAVDRISDIAADWPERECSRVERTLVWLVKLGVARHHPANAGT